MQLKIFQLEDVHTCPYAFMSYDFAQTHKFNLKDYRCVWEENIDSDTSLDDIFTRFNIDQPVGYQGRSLSVSDIIDIDGHKFYCDSFGWKEL